MFPVLFFALCREFMYLLAGVVFYSHGTSRRPLSSRIRPFLCGFHGVRHRSLEATGLGFSRTGSWPSEGTSGAWAPDGGFETHKDKETNRLGTVPELLNSIRFGITFVALKLDCLRKSRKFSKKVWQSLRGRVFRGSQTGAPSRLCAEIGCRRSHAC